MRRTIFYGWVVVASIASSFVGEIWQLTLLFGLLSGFAALGIRARPGARSEALPAAAA